MDQLLLRETRLLQGTRPNDVGRDRSSSAGHGEVFTKTWVVDLILDLIGYRSHDDLAGRVIVEPACGCGAFLVPIVDRLMGSIRHRGAPVGSCEDAIRALDVRTENVARSRRTVRDRLQQWGVASSTAQHLAALWVIEADFLLMDHPFRSADFVVGNPPYVRLEDVPAELTAAYRGACQTMRGRSDLYVGFIEVGLRLLRSGGKLGYICADRWMRNQYGSALREMITHGYAVDTVMTMHDVDAFQEEVSAYPAITILSRGPQGPVRLVDARSDFDEESAGALRSWAASDASSRVSAAGFDASSLPTWFTGPDLWPAGTPEQLELVADVEVRFPPLEDEATGTRVGIGVATGCDEVYITDDPSVVEADRLLPLLMAGDTAQGRPDWSGSFLVNPWTKEGLVELEGYPRLRSYLERHGERLRARHVARRRASAWYRTIDRVDPELRGRAKLLLPDLKAEAHPVLDRGDFYPHHNLYFVTSGAWDLEVLGGLLLSDVANLFVGTYCVKMRGGCYRFQAQYLRRIRVPPIGAVDERSALSLVDAFRSRDRAAATQAAAKLYGLDPEALRQSVQSSVE